MNLKTMIGKSRINHTQKGKTHSWEENGLQKSQAIPINPWLTSQEAQRCHQPRWSVFWMLVKSTKRQDPDVALTDNSHISFWHWLLKHSRCDSVTGSWQLESCLWLWATGRNQPSATINSPLMTEVGGKGHHHSYPLDPHFPSCHPATSTCISFSGSWRRGSLSLLTQHTANLIKSQIHNTLFKIQVFFTETSRRKGAEQNGPTKIIRIHL